jgi:hypothetical protein
LSGGSNEAVEVLTEETFAWSRDQVGRRSSWRSGTGGTSV